MKKTRQEYRSPLRERQAAETRRRIVEGARRLLESDGYTGMTIEAVAQRAGVSTQTVYAVFGSKTGILRELLNQTTFGPDYDDIVRDAMSEPDPERRLRKAAGIARKIHDAQSATFELLRGAGVVAPELAQLEEERECLRYERQKSMIDSLREAGRILPELTSRQARDILWTLTGGDLYRMLVRERGWSSQRYQAWLADTLVRSLLTRP
ncbi:TetR/AcrR family transcriptional regulator [Acidobacteria bacterium AB60]|nr:TetR/AcrR family transcriptional regulator [Acidobacteria bacterium AB60]